MSADPGTGRVGTTAPSKSAFAAGLGTSFRLGVGADGVDLRLAELREGAAGPGHESFALLFDGPADPVLGQGTYAVEHPALGTFALFVVPIGRDADRTSYEAVFNRLLEPDRSEGR